MHRDGNNGNAHSTIIRTPVMTYLKLLFSSLKSYIVHTALYCMHIHSSKSHINWQCYAYSSFQAFCYSNTTISIDACKLHITCRRCPRLTLTFQVIIRFLSPPEMRISLSFKRKHRTTPICPRSTCKQIPIHGHCIYYSQTIMLLYVYIMTTLPLILQILTVLSDDEEAMISLLHWIFSYIIYTQYIQSSNHARYKDTDRENEVSTTSWVCPCRVNSFSPVSKFQLLMVASPLPLYTTKRGLVSGGMKAQQYTTVE